MSKIKRSINIKSIILVMFLLFFSTLINSCSQEKETESKSSKNEVSSTRTAEQLVASKRTSEMSYKQLMTILSSGFIMVQQGTLTENKQMIIEGAGLILNHAAPKEKPWLIMNKQDQESFKNSLLTYDTILDNYAREITEKAKKENWLEVSKKTHELMNSCIVCHTMWKHKVK